MDITLWLCYGFPWRKKIVIFHSDVQCTTNFVFLNDYLLKKNCNCTKGKTVLFWQNLAKKVMRCKGKGLSDFFFVNYKNHRGMGCVLWIQPNHCAPPSVLIEVKKGLLFLSWCPIYILYHISLFLLPGPKSCQNFLWYSVGRYLQYYRWHCTYGRWWLRMPYGRVMEYICQPISEFP